MTHPEYIALVEQANRHSRLYYEESRPEISDQDFDAIIASIEAYEAANPACVAPQSPTRRVGDCVGGRRAVPHLTPMLSLQKAHAAAEVVEWGARAEKACGPLAYRVEWKLDGISCSLVYADGRLVSAATRGDGLRGCDIAAHAAAMQGVPGAIAAQGRVEVRGEIVCPKGLHASLGYADERTAASAICSASYSPAAQSLLFVAWEALLPGRAVSFAEGAEWLAANGFTPVGGCSVTLGGIASAIDRCAEMRSAMPWPADGLVVKIDDRAAYESMGATAHHPKGSVAYKFADARCLAQVRSIEVKVGKSGRRTPVATIYPVTLGGRVITKVSLCSEKSMAALGVEEGSRVLLALRHGVTPKILSLAPGVTAPEPASEPASEPAPLAPAPPQAAPSEPVPDADSDSPKAPLWASIAAAFIMLAACAAVFVVGAGMAVFFLPLLGGAFKKELFRVA